MRKQGVAYEEVAAPVDLSGEWIGYYPGHFDEVVRVTQVGEFAEAVKITGDEHVPGGAVTWRANVGTGIGEGQVAEQEFRNPRFIPGRLQVLGPERIKFSWGKLGSVEFRKDD